MVGIITQVLKVRKQPVTVVTLAPRLHLGMGNGSLPFGQQNIYHSLSHMSVYLGAQNEVDVFMRCIPTYPAL
jgi:hypothetical protein